MTHNPITPQKSQFLIYQAPDGQVKIDVRFDNNDVRLSRKLMSELFGCSVDNIEYHLKNIFSE